MPPKKFIKSYHPLVILSYYLILLGAVMTTTHPWLLMSYFIGSQSLQLITKRNYRSFGYSLFIMFILAVTNPLVVHRGGTILFFLLNKPVTMEALTYGFFMGVLFATIFLLFQNMHEALGSNAWNYLFGGKFPKMTMILTLIFRFIPLYTAYYQELSDMQQCLKNSSAQRFKGRVAINLALFSHLFSWSLENAMDTADAMAARGYGGQKRSSRVTYSWHFRDTLALFFCIFFVTLLFYMNLDHRVTYSYYPYGQSLIKVFQEQWLFYLGVLFFSIFPTILALKEIISWKILQLKI